MNAILEQFRAFGAGRLTAIFGLAVGVAAALVYFSGAVSGGSQALLYSGLDPAEAASTSEVLDQANISYEIREGGTAIYVDREQVDEARVRLASSGPLNGASVGYEIFDRQDSFGQTSFVQNINAKRALEGELARTIQSLAFVNSARVHLNLPERRLFTRDQQDPTAAVTISSGQRLNSEQVRVIRNIVASGAGLEPGNISLSDDRGRVLANAMEDGAAGTAYMDERRAEIETAMRQNILDIVEGVVGPGAARVQVTADLNRQSVTQSSETFDPEGSVLLSRERSEDISNDQDGNRNRVSASENLPDAAGEAGNEGPSSVSTRETSSETVNYRLSSTTRTEVIEAGAVERLSVAVAVDGIVDLQEDGSTVWRERPQAQIDQIEALVRSAMGYAESRGDSLTVRQIEFARADPLLGTPATSGFSFSKNDLMRVAEIIVLFVTALLIIFLVARPLVKGASGAPMPQGLALAGAGAGAQPAVAAAPPPAALPAGGGAAGALPAVDQNDSIDIEKIDGQVKASSLKKVANIVESHPEESISILRSWLHEG
ncbi:flagellar basal-body MS-ring/collar protein FliF [Maricaulis alexandrii]|uniref:flagellar basal-body MS-ring/collar protein FliF n=1 Tax=Maricaulis alexandrii TaxID=2570354 RepID=UPI001108A603|nr:flagellar basal-body MS-ring/collar protein FliF [Maricaulis alexandrii]